MSTSLVEFEHISDDTPDSENIAAQTSGGEYLSFELGGELFCVDILSVCEIRGWQAPTLLPNAPEHIKGVINIRGDVIPVIDLRLKFGVGTAKYSKHTVIIVLKTYTMDSYKTIGVVVDSVSDVFNFNPSDLREAPETSTELESDFVKGLCNYQDKVVVVLDMNKVLDLTDIDNYYKAMV